MDTAYVPPGPSANVRLNEVLAKNSSTSNVGGVFPDIIELYNAGDVELDLSSWTAGQTQPEFEIGLIVDFKGPSDIGKSGTVLEPGAYAVVVSNTLGSVTNAGGMLTVIPVTIPGVTLDTLYSFRDANDGGSPSAPLVQATNGNLYGTASEGGASTGDRS